MLNQCDPNRRYRSIFNQIQKNCYPTRNRNSNHILGLILYEFNNNWYARTAIVRGTHEKKHCSIFC